MREEGRGEAPSGRRRPGDRPFIPFARFEDIVVRCGHVEKFGLMPDGKDRFREDRRKKAISRDCKACREKKQQVELEAAQRRDSEKQQRKSQSNDRSPRSNKTRLPDGSRFEVKYDASKEQWIGTLTVPTSGEASATFSESRSSLFKLLASLDDQYRATQRQVDSTVRVPDKGES
jgi:hypothetical protein